jgi:hypothetical protein
MQQSKVRPTTEGTEFSIKGLLDIESATCTQETALARAKSVTSLVPGRG